MTEDLNPSSVFLADSIYTTEIFVFWKETIKKI